MRTYIGIAIAVMGLSHPLFSQSLVSQIDTPAVEGDLTMSSTGYMEYKVGGAIKPAKGTATAELRRVGGSVVGVTTKAVSFPGSILVHSTSPGVAPYCYSARLQAATEGADPADDSDETVSDDNLCYATNSVGATLIKQCDGCTGTSPLVLDLAGHGYRLSGDEEPVLFDFDGDGVGETTGWTAAGSQVAFLARDLDANGMVNTGAELFGNWTRLLDGSRATNGFEALREVDDNLDGRVDASDSIWTSLLLWVDADHNGVSDSSEITSIAGSVVESISTDYIYTGRVDSSGNMFRQMGSATIANRPRRIFDVWFIDLE